MACFGRTDDDMKKLVLIAALFTLIALAGCAQGGTLGSAQSGTGGGVQGSAGGSAQGDAPGSAQGSAGGGVPGEVRGSVQGDAPGSAGMADNGTGSQVTGPLSPQVVTQETLAAETALLATDIGEAKAKEIALSHAGYTMNEVQRLKIERDYDDGRLEYEVEFYIGRMEYSYEIDAASGTVLSYEAEQDD
jgi:uncharacterized membrane protein YkoI